MDYLVDPLVRPGRRAVTTIDVLRIHNRARSVPGAINGDRKMLKSTLAALLAVAVMSAGSIGASAEPKCKAGQIYSEEAGKCVKAPQGS